MRTTGRTLIVALSLAGLTLGWTPTPSNLRPVRTTGVRRHRGAALFSAADDEVRELELEARELAVKALELRCEAKEAEMDMIIEKNVKESGVAVDPEASAAAVLAANQAFYTAHQSRRLADMRKVWSKDSAVVIHAGKPVIAGYQDVMHSYTGVFRSKSVESIKCSDPRLVALSQQTAVVVCNEEYTGASKMVATNVFQNNIREDKWELVSHHSSPVMFPNIPRPRNETGRMAMDYP